MLISSLQIVEQNTCGETRAEALKSLFDFLCYHGFSNIKLNTPDLSSMRRSTNFQDESENILERSNELDFAGVFTEIINKLLTQPIYDVDKQKTLRQAFIEHQMFEITVKGLCKIMDLGASLYFYLAQIINPYCEMSI